MKPQSELLAVLKLVLPGADILVSQQPEETEIY